MTTAYDEVAYPSKLFDLTHPDRLAVFARLHGLFPAPAATARVLEIGCGEGFNLLGLAAEYPQARLEGFDLAETAIAAGQAQADAAGLPNVVLKTCDILEAEQVYPAGSFDYVIAHGVYAWVPEHVREAVMAFTAHALAPNGVAYISYNAMPGGHFRMVMRDLLLHELEGVTDPAERLAKAREVLQQLVEHDSKGEISIELLRRMAEDLLEKHEIVLFHDELGDVYAPHSLTDAVANAARGGLRYLSDSDYVRVYEGFLADETQADAPPAEQDRIVVRLAQSRDNRNTCFFRSSLFVRADAPVRRALDLASLDDLWISCNLKYDAEKDEFRGSKNRAIKLADEGINAIFHQLSEAHPGRLAMKDVLHNEGWREVFMKLFSVACVDLHFGPAPFVTSVGERPETSALARSEIARGRITLPRLDHDDTRIEQAHVRALLLAANGERTAAEIAAALDGAFPADEVLPALNAAARYALMRA